MAESPAARVSDAAKLAIPTGSFNSTPVARYQSLVIGSFNPNCLLSSVLSY